jgi:hypothetical protein
MWARVWYGCKKGVKNLRQPANCIALFEVVKFENQVKKYEM